MEKLERELEEEAFEEKKAKDGKKQEAGRGADGQPSPDALKKWFLWAGLAILACLIAAAGGSLFSSVRDREEAAVLEVVSVSSVEMRLNRKGKILRVIGLNEEGWDLLKSLELKKKSLEDGITDLFGKMADRGYPDQSGIIVMTVRESGAAGGARIDRLAEQSAVFAETVLRKKQANTILYIGAARMEGAKEIAKEYAVPYSHAYLVKDLINKNTKLKLEDAKRLARLDIAKMGREIEDNNYSITMQKVTLRGAYKQKEETQKKTEPESEPVTESVSESAKESGEASGETRKETESRETTGSKPAKTEAAPSETAAPETTEAPAETSPQTEPTEAPGTPAVPEGETAAPETTTAAPAAAETEAETKSDPGAGTVNPLGPGYAPEVTQPENYGPGATDPTNYGPGAP